jgi:hypothetical protein
MNGLEENSEENQASTGPMGSIHDKYTTFANDKDQDQNDVFKHTFVDIPD